MPIHITLEKIGLLTCVIINMSIVFNYSKIWTTVNIFLQKEEPNLLLRQLKKNGENTGCPPPLTFSFYCMRWVFTQLLHKQTHESLQSLLRRSIRSIRNGVGMNGGDSSNSPDTPSTLSKIWTRSKATFHTALSLSNLCLFPDVILLPVLHSPAAFSLTWFQLQIS